MTGVPRRSPRRSSSCAPGGTVISIGNVNVGAAHEVTLSPGRSRARRSTSAASSATTPGTCTARCASSSDARRCTRSTSSATGRTASTRWTRRSRAPRSAGWRVRRSFPARSQVAFARHVSPGGSPLCRVPSPSSPASGPTCRSPNSRRSPRSMGYDGLELACWGDHFDVTAAIEQPGYVDDEARAARRARPAVPRDLQPPRRPGRLRPHRRAPQGDPLAGASGATAIPRACASAPPTEMGRTAEAARAFGVDVVNGFTGSSIWHSHLRVPADGPGVLGGGLRGLRRRAGRRSWTRSRRTACASGSRCTRPRSRSTSRRPSVRSRRSAATRSSASTTTRRTSPTRASTTSRSSAASPIASSTPT